MIQIFKDYYDSKGRKYKVLQYIGGRYLCEAYNGKQMYMSPGELFQKPPKEMNGPTLQSFSGGIDTDLEYIFDNTPDIKIDISKTEVTKKEIVKEEKKEAVEKNKDNIKETASDFYADFMQ